MESSNSGKVVSVEKRVLCFTTILITRINFKTKFEVGVYIDTCRKEKLYCENRQIKKSDRQKKGCLRYNKY